MFNWEAHDKKQCSPVIFTYKEAKRIESVLAEKIRVLEPHWKNSSDPVDKADFKFLDGLHTKIIWLMTEVDLKNPVEQI